jgi:hypothetical protein
MDRLMRHKYLFILCPPASGSTLLWELLQTSPQVSALPGEGQSLVKDILFTTKRWDPDLKIPWKQVKKSWQASWDLSKPVLLEKSPPHLVRARQLEENFPNSYFVVMMRNPYAFCEGIKRRWKKELSISAIARFWAAWATYQIDNCRILQKALFLTYEKFTDGSEQACRQLIEFMPDLQELHPERNFNVFEKTQKIENLNLKQIRRLTPADMLKINGVLRTKPELMHYFHYAFLDNPLQE